MQNLKTSDLIFPTASLSVSAQIAALGKSHASISNRLRSIYEDSCFVRQVSSDYKLPVIANERCGSWYVPPDIKAGSAYFKSTDGHHGVWSCSLRRLNLSILDVIGENGGCILVDSTKRGKHFPDALSKTVPIWCAVINRLLFPDLLNCHDLERLPQLVSLSEHSQIEARIDGFVSSFKALDLHVESIRKRVVRPIRPIWISRDLKPPSLQNRESIIDSDQYHLMFLCMPSSYQESSVTGSSSGYIQGAGDDEDHWAFGLTPQVFWSSHAELLGASEDALPDLVKSLMQGAKNTGSRSSFVPISPASQIFLGPVPQSGFAVEPSDLVIICAPSVEDVVQESFGTKLLHLKTAVGKLGSRDLRTEINKLTEFLDARNHLASIFVMCHTGKDISAGVVLALLCLYIDDTGAYIPRQEQQFIDKTFIRKRLSWITSAIPSANPSRTTLTAINAFLMKPS